ncbi:MAG: hypothetical protein CMM91_06115 [Rickettsiales bacterium]|jgi:predicted nucleotidyltransferase|nr:hypothetical protein [Rickettsiales bacterium]
MQYKGYVYKPSYDRDSDGFNKISHEIHDKNANTICKSPIWFRNITPYRQASYKEFVDAVEHIKEQEFWIWTASKYKESLRKLEG